MGVWKFMKSRKFYSPCMPRNERIRDFGVVVKTATKAK